MSDRVKGGKVKRKAKSRSDRAGRVFSVEHGERQLLNCNYAERDGVAEPLYLAAVVEFLAAELLELASNAARMEDGKIFPRHLRQAFLEDRELYRLLYNFCRSCYRATSPCCRRPTN